MTVRKPPPLLHSPALDPRPSGLLPDLAEVLDAFAQDLGEQGYSAFTIRDYRTDVLRLAHLSGVTLQGPLKENLRKAEAALESLGQNLAARRRRLSAYAKFLRFLGAERRPLRPAHALWEAAAKASPFDRLLLALVYGAGLRLVEISHLEGRDLRMRQGILQTRVGCRILPIHRYVRLAYEAVRSLDELPHFRPILQGHQGFALNTRTLHARFQRLMARLGWRDLRPDILRRQAAAELTELGTPRGLVRAFLGKDRGKPIAPRKGRFLDLTSLAERFARMPLVSVSEERSQGAKNVKATASEAAMPAGATASVTAHCA